MQRRYDVQSEEDDTWTVIDVFTGLPVVIGGFDATGFEAEDASVLLGMLNKDDYERRREAGMIF